MTAWIIALGVSAAAWTVLFYVVDMRHNRTVRRREPPTPQNPHAPNPSPCALSSHDTPPSTDQQAHGRHPCAQVNTRAETSKTGTTKTHNKSVRPQQRYVMSSRASG